MNRTLLLVALAALATLTYSDHFHNDFHFDDFHTIVQNPYIRDLHNIPRFFTDPNTASVLPANRAWRPLVYVSLALDYSLAHGLKPLHFQISTFLWFLVLLALLFALFQKILDNLWAAWFGAALFAVHPGASETINYIIQRAELFSTLGVVASLVLWIYQPSLRKYGLYLIPLAAGLLAKPPGMVFPVLLFLYILLFEAQQPKAALKQCLPSLAVVIALGWLTAAMIPTGFTPGAVSAYGYRITQPSVIFGYFRTFLIPTALSADTDRVAYSSIFHGDALFGFAFVIGLCYAAIRLARQQETKPIAFGLFWFLIACVPASIFPLAEVENDHRMFFPFVGLALSAACTIALWTQRRAAIAVAAAILLIFAAATFRRNQTWRTEESLWQDVALKSPHNGRGLMNYGLTLMAKGDLPGALDDFNRAAFFNPNYYVLEVNLGVVNGALHRDALAEQHFLRAIQLAPNEAVPRYYYARWLNERARPAEAVQHLNLAIANNPDFLDASRLLPEAYLNLSLALYRQNKFDDCIQAAREALKLRPSYSEAWNNIAAAYNAQSKWDQGIAAAIQAVRANPANQLAKNNLAWALQQKQKAR